MINTENPHPVDILIGGVQKAATSSLLRYMSEHPDVISNPVKEFTYFILEEEWKQGYPKQYELHFGQNYDPKKKVLAKSAGIIYFEHSMKHLKEHNPDAKLIIVFRNPVDRAYSAYWFACLQGHETIKTFEEAINSPITRTDNVLTRGIIDYKGRGHYAEQLEMLYTYFDKKNVLVLLQEDLQKDMQGVIKNIFQFSGLDDSFTPDLGKKYRESARSKSQLLSNYLSGNNIFKKIVKRIFPSKVLTSARLKLRDMNSENFTPPKMNPEIRKELVAHYKPYNEALSKLIGRDLSSWNK